MDSTKVLRFVGVIALGIVLAAVIGAAAITLTGNASSVGIGVIVGAAVAGRLLVAWGVIPNPFS